MTKLDAVNEVLASINLPAVTSLNPGSVTEEADAEKEIDRYLDRVLRYGWSCNTARERTYTPSGGEISMAGVLSFAGDKYGQLYAIQDDKLFDPDEDTTAFTDDVTLLNVVFTQTFEQLPDHVADVVVAEAAASFVRHRRQDLTEDRRYAARVSTAWREARQLESRIGMVNLLQTEHGRRVRGYPYGNRA